MDEASREKRIGPGVSPKPKPFRLLDVKTYAQGWLQLRSLFLLSFLMFLNAACFFAYERVIYNVEDRDSRDIIYDHRVTLQGIQGHHAHFRTASWPAFTLDTAQFVDYTRPYLLMSNDLPVVVYHQTKLGAPGCKLQLQIPCYSTDADDRAAASGALNVGTDLGQWSVSPTQSLLRNETFQGLVYGLKAKYASFAVFSAAFLLDRSILSSMPSEVPPPRALNLTAAASAQWTTTDWLNYANMTWASLNNVTCLRTFDICSQVIGALEAVASEAGGGVHVHVDPNREDYPSYNVGCTKPGADGTLTPYRAGCSVADAMGSVPEGNIDFNVKVGYVPPSGLRAYVLKTAELFPPAAGYLPPPASGNLASVLLNGLPAALTLHTATSPRLKKLNDWPRELWPGKEWAKLWAIKKCSDTETVMYTLNGTLPGLNRPAFAPDTFPALQLEVLGEVRSVNWFDFRPSFDSGLASVAPLSGLLLLVEYSPMRAASTASWSVSRLTPRYSVAEEWTGPIAEAAAAFPPFNQAVVTVTMTDVSQPEPVAFPMFTGGYRMLVVVFSMLVTGLVILVTPCLLYTLHVHVMENNKMPPPFYRHTLKYRGW